MEHMIAQSFSHFVAYLETKQAHRTLMIYCIVFFGDFSFRDNLVKVIDIVINASFPLPHLIYTITQTQNKGERNKGNKNYQDDPKCSYFYKEYLIYIQSYQRLYLFILFLIRFLPIDIYRQNHLFDFPVRLQVEVHIRRGNGPTLTFYRQSNIPNQILIIQLSLSALISKQFKGDLKSSFLILSAQKKSIYEY